MTERGKKADTGKAPLALIPPIALEAEARAFQDGMKYGQWNFLQGLEATRLASAAMRHLTDWLKGEELTPDSGVHHLGCARAELGMLLALLENGKLIDDRYKVSETDFSVFVKGPHFGQISLAPDPSDVATTQIRAVEASPEVSGLSEVSAGVGPWRFAPGKMYVDGMGCLVRVIRTDFTGEVDDRDGSYLPGNGPILVELAGGLGYVTHSKKHQRWTLQANGTYRHNSQFSTTRKAVVADLLYRGRNKPVPTGTPAEDMRTAVTSAPEGARAGVGEDLRTVAGGGTRTLEVGRSYKRRDGEVTTVVKREENGSVYPFWTNQGRCYTARGRWSTHRERPYDLIEEVEIETNLDGSEAKPRAGRDL